jgi:hypothetical protein
MNIYVMRNGQQYGPYTQEWLLSFTKDGSISREDLARMDGTEEWVPLRTLLDEPQREEIPRPDATQPTPLSSPVAGPSTVVARPPRSAVPWRKRLSRLALVVGTLLLGTVLTAIAAKPEHVAFALDGETFLRPDPGYVFVDRKDSMNWKVQWAPGTPSVAEQHVLAGSDEGTWVPAPGYERSKDANGSVVWVEGKREAGYPHVRTAAIADTWLPDPGYVLTDSAAPTRPNVAWTAGIKLTHLTSADREGYWNLDDGYQFAPDATQEEPRAVWSPGARHRRYPHVYAASDPDKWRADAGYAWVSTTPGDLRTFSFDRTRDAWSTIEAVDLRTRGIDCSWSSALPVISEARDAYATMATDELPPDLAQNITAMRTELASGASTLTGCVVADNAGDAADVTAGVLCLSALFSDNDSWNDCMKRSETPRKVVGGIGKLGTVACDSALRTFRTNIDQLIIDRQKLRADYRDTYGLALVQPGGIVTCK